MARSQHKLVQVTLEVFYAKLLLIILPRILHPSSFLIFLDTGKQIFFKRNVVRFSSYSVRSSHQDSLTTKKDFFQMFVFGDH